MKIKIKDKKKPITQMWCFNSAGYDAEIINKINSGEAVKVERIPKPALEFVKEEKPKKETK